MQGRKTVADTLALCYAAVTYHELFKLAARDAIAAMQADEWRKLYSALDADGDGTGSLNRDEVTAGLRQRGASDDEVRDIVRSLFTGSTNVEIELFVRRATRLRDGLQLQLLGDSETRGLR